MGVELLDPFVAYVANVDMAVKVESQAYGIVELPVAGTEGAELAQIHSVCVEFLDAIVASVGDAQVAARVDGDILGIVTLSVV
jgi:hypothetical protein